MEARKSTSNIQDISKKSIQKIKVSNDLLTDRGDQIRFTTIYPQIALENSLFLKIK